LETGLQQAGQSVTGLGTNIQQLGNKSNELNRLVAAQKQYTSELDQLKNRFSYFFTMTNGVNLLRRALTSTIKTVKDLDAAMTETAVVTKNSVSDMWDKLPQYTAQANKLSTSILSMYKATTLYYQ
jgi:ABC-type transporter Mla subunit MlaD